jgi:hypothetical protein
MRESATRGPAPRESVTRGFATREFPTRGRATRDSVTRGRATREFPTRGRGAAAGRCTLVSARPRHPLARVCLLLFLGEELLCTNVGVASERALRYGV